MVRVHGIDGDTWKLVLEELHQGAMLQAVKAERELAAARELNNRVHFRSRDGTAVGMRVPRSAYAYWAAREGQGVWDDGFHLRYMRKHFPELWPARTEAAVLTVGWSGNVRSRTVYPAERGAA